MAIQVDKAQLSRFLKGIRLGMKIKHAAAYGDFNPKTFYEWQKKARGLWPDGGEWPDEVAFFKRYQRTKATKVAGLLANVHKGAAVDWRAAMRLLELDGYTVTKEVELAGKGGAPLAITFDLSGLSDADLDAAEKKIKGD